MAFNSNNLSRRGIKWPRTGLSQANSPAMAIKKASPASTHAFDMAGRPVSGSGSSEKASKMPLRISQYVTEPSSNAKMYCLTTSVQMVRQRKSAPTTSRRMRLCGAIEITSLSFRITDSLS